jgi:NAD(P)-dependent dehydrogenase (short-subunit alcohol dehydrogenase family)
VSEDVREKLRLRVPLGRFGEPDEIGRAVLYLVRDGDYITGSCLNVNGGIFM